MSETQLSLKSSFQGSSTGGNSVGMEGNLPRQAEPQAPVQPQVPEQPQIHVQPTEPAQAPQNFPDVQTVQREFLMSMKGMFDHLVSNLRQEHPTV
ncbi:hypothetical protein GQ457_01G021060 [Hibiscus cannabinus]